PDVTRSVAVLANCAAVQGLTFTQDPVAGALVGLGTTSITVTATDVMGRTGKCTTTLTVVDATPPTILSCGINIRVPAGANCQAAVPNVLSAITASDNCTPSGSLVFTQSPAAGTLVNLGTTVITVTATDAAGNTGSCTTTFTVADTTAPVITLMGADPLLV